MKKIALNPQNLPSVFKDKLQNDNSVFIFSTDIVLNSWMDWIVTHADLSGTDAVPFERFIAWDNFKGEYLSAGQKNATAIPSLLRKLFVNDLIEKNAQKPESERFQSVINPKDEFAQSASSFSEWICGNLPSLHFWKKRLDKYKAEYGQLDAEDKDYQQIYDAYSNFLKQNNLFEPSWIEDLSLENKEKEFVIFYPELLQDFSDYTDIFEKAENVTLYTLPKDLPSPKAYLYPDSRTELRQTMLRIIELVQTKKADWSEITLSIPDIETYRPYIEREFDLYQIPYVIKAGNPLTKNCAGRIFREIYNCYNDNFTFDSVRTLLLDECVPWKEELLQIKEDLIRVGNEMRCICSPYEKDVWLSALTSKINRLENDDEKTNYTTLKDFYLKLKTSVNQFFNKDNNTFENIRRSWMQFKSEFLQPDEMFSETSNNILSRCIKELEEIIKIEKDFAACNLQLKSPFDFFLELIDSKTYTPQTKKSGVQIFKYKLSAAAAFKFQFVIDGSQKNLEIPYKRLSFFNANKRIKLHLSDDDKELNSTEVFMKLYAKPTDGASQEFYHFSAATNSFSGFAIPHSLLDYTDKNLPNLDSSDYILAEKKFIQSNGTAELLFLTPSQKQMFQNWLLCSKSDVEKEIKNSALNELLQARYNPENKKINVSARGDLEKFFPCPRKWIFQSVLKFKEDTLDTNLMQSYDMGNLNHKILELFMDTFTGKKLPFFNKEQDAFFIEDKKEGDLIGASVDYTQELKLQIRELSKKAILSIKDFKDCPLVIKTLQDQVEKIADVIISFLKKLLLPYPVEGVGNCTVYALEKSLSSEKSNYNYTGRIDSLLLSQDGNLIVIDYKNSKYSMPKTGELFIDENSLLHDFQMPLYKIITEEQIKKEIDALYYYSIKEKEKRSAVDVNILDTKTGEQKLSLQKYELTVKELDVYASLFTEKVSNLNFEPVHSNDEKCKLNVKTYENCTKCNFRSICRTTYSVAGREIKNEKTGGKNE